MPAAAAMGSIFTEKTLRNDRKYLTCNCRDPFMGYHEDLLRVYKLANPKDYRNVKKTPGRRDNVLLDSGYYSTTAWGAFKCWKGFKIAESEWDMKNMFYYAKGIRRLQRELKISMSEFAQFRLISRITAGEEAQNSSGQSYAQTQIEFENYELQEQNQREPDPTGFHKS